MKRVINILQTIAKYGALFGFGFYVFLFNGAVKAKALNPDAGLLDIAGEFYSGMSEIAVQSFLPGAGIVLHEIFRLATDILLPGAGTVLTSAFNILSHGGASALLPPAPSL